MILSNKYLGGHGYYGYKYNSETDEYDVVKEEATVIKIISLLLVLGYPFSTVVRIMNDLGVRIPSGYNKGKPITTTWIKRKFGIYKRPTSTDGLRYDEYSEDSRTYFEKYNGANGFPQIVGDKVYDYVAEMLKDRKYRKEYNGTKSIGLCDSKNKKVIIKNIKKQIPFE